MWPYLCPDPEHKAEDRRQRKEEESERDQGGASHGAPPEIGHQNCTPVHRRQQGPASLQKQLETVSSPKVGGPVKLDLILTLWSVANIQ
jgi:hypothetical protein